MSLTLYMQCFMLLVRSITGYSDNKDVNNYANHLRNIFLKSSKTCVVKAGLEFL